MLLIQTCKITDAIYYDNNTYISDTIKSIPDIPTNFKCIYTAKRTTTGVAWIEIGSDSNNNVFGGIISDRGMIGAYSRKNGSYEKNQYTNGYLSVAEHEIEVTFENGTITTQSENLTAQITGSTITSRNWQKIHLTGSGGYIKDIIILPL